MWPLAYTVLVKGPYSFISSLPSLLSFLSYVIDTSLTCMLSQPRYLYLCIWELKNLPPQINHISTSSNLILKTLKINLSMLNNTLFSIPFVLPTDYPHLQPFIDLCDMILDLKDEGLWAQLYRHIFLRVSYLGIRHYYGKLRSLLWIELHVILNMHCICQKALYFDLSKLWKSIICCCIILF